MVLPSKANNQQSNPKTLSKNTGRATQNHGHRGCSSRAQENTLVLVPKPNPFRPDSFITNGTWWPHWCVERVAIVPSLHLLVVGFDSQKLSWLRKKIEIQRSIGSMRADLSWLFSQSNQQLICVTTSAKERRGSESRVCPLVTHFGCSEKVLGFDSLFWNNQHEFGNKTHRLNQMGHEKYNSRLFWVKEWRVGCKNSCRKANSHGGEGCSAWKKKCHCASTTVRGLFCTEMSMQSLQSHFNHL